MNTTVGEMVLRYASEYGIDSALVFLSEFFDLKGKQAKSHLPYIFKAIQCPYTPGKYLVLDSDHHLILIPELKDRSGNLITDDLTGANIAVDFNSYGKVKKALLITLGVEVRKQKGEI